MGLFAKLSLTVLIFFFSLTSAAVNANARALEDCNPRISGFWRNLSCQDEWKQRIELRETELSRLQTEFRDLSKQNASLHQQVQKSQQIVAHLEAGLEPSRARLRALQQIRTDQQNSNDHILALIDEYEYLAKALGALEQAQVGCETVEIKRFRAKANVTQVALQEGLGLLWGYVKSRVAEAVIGVLTPKKWDRRVNKAFKAVDLINTGVSVIKSGQKVYDAYNDTGVYTEKEVRCS